MVSAVYWFFERRKVGIDYGPVLQWLVMKKEKHLNQGDK